MEFLLFVLLLRSTLASSYSFSDVVIDYSVISSGPITFLSAGDKCRKIVAEDIGIYHVSTESVFESWSKGSLGAFRGKEVVPEAVTDYDLDPGEARAVFATNAGSAGIRVIEMDGGGSITSTNSFVTVETGVNISANGIGIVQMSIFSGNPRLDRYDTSGASLAPSSDVLYAFSEMKVSPNRLIGVFWNDNSEFAFIDMATDAFLWFILPANYPPSPVTQDFAFSSDSSLIVYETDGYNELEVISTSNYTVMNSFAISDTIQKTLFLNGSNEILLVFGSTAFLVLNLTSNVTYSMPPLLATDYAGDYSFFYTCFENVLSQYKLTVGPPSSASATTSVDPEAEFYLALVTTEEEKAALSAMDGSLAIASDLTTNLASVVVSIPLTIYFLGFLNYFVLCSLYVLLNFPIPEHVYKYLGSLYEDVNGNLFSIIGVTIQMDPLSDEKVTSNRGLFYGVSSDVLSGNLVSFIFLFSNIGFVAIAQLMLLWTRKHNFVRKLFDSQKWDLIYGQVTGLLIPLALPWTFMVIDSGISNFQSKFNLVAYILLLYVGIVFPIYYLLELLDDREKELRGPKWDKNRGDRKKQPISLHQKKILQLQKHFEDNISPPDLQETSHRRTRPDKIEEISER
jgi:hypothetical protein